MSARRDLFVSSYAPTLGSGRALRTYTCIRALAMHGPLDLAYVPHGGEGPSREYQEIEGLAFHEIQPSRGLHRGWIYGSKRLRGVPDLACRGTSPELAEVAERLAELPGRGRVIVGDVASATALLPRARRRPFIYNAHNIEYEYVEAGPITRPGARLAMRTYERRLLRAAAESWMVSRADMATAATLVPHARLRYVPNVVDVGAIVPAPRGEPASRLLMVADFTYAPNQSGRDFVVEQVLPRVWATLGEARLTLVGRGLEDWASPDLRVQVAGFVDRLAPAYAAADCVVVPLTEGKGSPLKFVEALAYQVPVVATSVAARGLDVTPDVHYREGGDADEFAAAVIDVLGQGAEQMAAAGRRLAEQEYSIETLAERIGG